MQFGFANGHKGGKDDDGDGDDDNDGDCILFGKLCSQDSKALSTVLGSKNTVEKMSAYSENPGEQRYNILFFLKLN